MRLIRFFAEDGGVHLGVLEDYGVLDVTLAGRRVWGKEFTSPLPFIAEGEAGLRRLRALLGVIRIDRELAREVTLPHAGLHLDAPLRDSPKLLALAGNYRQHVIESGYAVTDVEGVVTPQVFMKPVSTSLCAPDTPILIRPNNVFVDWEIELAVVIGQRGRDISPDQAMSYVFGYSIINDINERRFNGRRSGRKVRENDSFFDWLMGKWFDGFAPFGPALVTTDEVPDPHALSIRLWINHQLMQDANTSQMISRISDTISYISAVMTLEPGDIIAMGTPGGVGMARGISLHDGDRIRGEVDGLGALENTVALEERSARLSP